MKRTRNRKKKKQQSRRKLKIEVTDRQSVVELSSETIESVVSTVLRQEDAGGDISVAVVDDEEIQKLNKEFLGRDRVTDVLAFPYEDEDRCIAGEVIVNAEIAARQVAERSHSAEDETLLYVVHGLLHMLGYDDHQEDEATKMHRREVELLRHCGRHVSV